MVDLKELGFDGTEPAIFQLAREAVKKEEPAIWDSVLSSPLARKYMVRGWLGMLASGRACMCLWRRVWYGSCW